MFRHGDVWRAIDRLAHEHGMSTSKLARKAGLDPTTFNRSKRTSKEGKLRWPSTESLSKILEATGATIGEFMSYLSDEDVSALRNIPLIGFAQAGDNGFFDDGGFPIGGGWDEINFPGFGDPAAYALEISGDSMDPVYRDGDIVIVSPSAPLRRNDRVVARTTFGEIMAKVLVRKSARRLELKSLNPAHEDREIAMEHIDWVARIVWASQ